MSEVCHEETVDDEGMLGPCDAPMFGYRIDPEEGDRYPVCRQHYRPPFTIEERLRKVAEAAAAVIAGRGDRSMKHLGAHEQLVAALDAWKAEQ